MKKKGAENQWEGLREGWESAVWAPLAICIYLGIVQVLTSAGKRYSHSTVESIIIKACRGHYLVGCEMHPVHFLTAAKEITSLKGGPALKPADTTMGQTSYGRHIWLKASHNLTTVCFLQKTALLVIPKNCRPSTGKTAKTARLAEDRYMGTWC